MPHLGQIRRAVSTISVLLLACVWAQASATLLLEEPYGKMGFFTATGHAAVYLSGVCADTPVVLRPCAPGETGIVISRYDGVAGYDWVAIPLIPYLYAVERADDIPLFVDSKMVGFLRDQYRRNHFESLAQDRANGDAPSGNWYELVGTAYDRSTYAFQIETTAAQDAAFIRTYNSSANRSHFHLVTRNCADFAKDVLNFYYPRALHRSIIADAGITTPKQMAKTLIKFSERHSQWHLSRFVIAQVPGTPARSTPVHGVVESFLKSKKYIVPSVVVSPIFAGCVAAVYVGTGAGHFDPARPALIFNAEGSLAVPLGAEDRRSYEDQLKHLSSEKSADAHVHAEKDWGHLLAKAAPGFDEQGRPVVRVALGETVETVGIAGSNISNNSDAAASFTQKLLEARLHAELRKGAAQVSESDVERDWNLLQKTLSPADTEVAAQARRPLQTGYSLRSERAGNRP